MQYSDEPKLISITSGALAEQYVGQHLLFNTIFFKKPSLYYWNREKKSRFAIKFSSSRPPYNQLDTIIPGSEQLTFNLLSIPFYLIGQCRRLLFNYQSG
jgi:hypothetical protein